MESIMWEALEVFFSITSIALYFLFVLAFLGRKGSASAIVKIAIVAIVLSMRLLLSFVFSENFMVILILSTFSVFLIGFVFYKNKAFNSVITAFFSTLSGGVSESIAVFWVMSSHDVPAAEFTELSIYRIQMVALSNLIMLLVIAIIKLLRKGSMSIMNKKALLVMCTVPIISSLILQQYAFYFVTLPYAPAINEAIPILIITMVSVLMFIIFEVLIRQNEKNQQLMLVRAQNDAHIAHINQLIQHQKQIRTMSHDFRQQVQELYTLSIEKQYDKLQDKLTELSNRSSKDLAVDTGNITLDSILTSKIEVAEMEKINFKRKLDVKAELKYMDAKICVLIGNALDNAIEACMKSEFEKFIGMELTATPKQFLCHIINTLGEMPQPEGEFLKTSKKNALHHGVGLQSMSQICEELGGTMTYNYDEQHFNIWINITFTDASM